MFAGYCAICTLAHCVQTQLTIGVNSDLCLWKVCSKIKSTFGQKRKCIGMKLQIIYRENVRVDYEILKSWWFWGKTHRKLKTVFLKMIQRKKKNATKMIRLNMKILFQFMPRAFDNSSTPRNAFQFHSHLKCIHTHWDFCGVQVVENIWWFSMA